MQQTYQIVTTMDRGCRTVKPKFRPGVRASTLLPCDCVLEERGPNCRKTTINGRENKNGVNAVNGVKRVPKDTKCITAKDYLHFREQSHVLTKEERDALLAEVEKEKEKLAKESMERKEAIRKIDMAKSLEKDARLSEIDEEARKRTMHILERACNLKLEQEEEIQKCNKIILGTKCRAIRDAQIAEKKLIKREMEEEEKRLNDMMENERRWALKEDLKKEQEEMARKHEFAELLKEQIKENEEHRIMEFEKKQEESRLINLSNIAWQQEEATKLRNRGEENQRFRRELFETNQQLQHFKAMEKEENRIIEKRMKEFQKEKEEREAQRLEDQRLEKLRKDKERDRIASQAKYSQDLRAHIDEINAARVQEEVERQWRKKEKEEAIKKAEAQKALMAEREKQINTKRIMQAIAIERDRKEFERVLRAQQEAFCREKEEMEKKQQEVLIHRTEILKQVNEKERERIKTRQKMFEEGTTIRMEAALRKKKLREAMERKCQEMRQNKVPEIYINEVKRLTETMD